MMFAHYKNAVLSGGSNSDLTVPRFCLPFSSQQASPPPAARVGIVYAPLRMPNHPPPEQTKITHESLACSSNSFHDEAGAALDEVIAARRASPHSSADWILSLDQPSTGLDTFGAYSPASSQPSPNLRDLPVEELCLAYVTLPLSTGKSVPQGNLWLHVCFSISTTAL